MSARRLYLSQCLLLLAVVTPLAVAEWKWLYLSICLLCALIGWQRTIVQDRPLLGPATSRIIVIAAFLWLISEYFRDTTISVVALSQFMIVVCLTKLLQRRSYRDHAQFFVLTLLLLVVAAIVSGNLLFPLALAVFLTVGLDALIRFHLDIERTRARRHNRRIDWAHAGLLAEGGPGPGTMRLTAGITLVSSLVGTSVFVLCPRLAANSLFPRFDSPRVGHTITGFTSTLNFTTIGPIAESDRPVMRVIMEIDGKPSGELPAGPYFRGAVLSEYRCEHPASMSGWEWKRGGAGGGPPRLPLPLQADEEGYIDLLPDAPLDDPGRILVQRYFLDSSNDNVNLFICSPALRIRFDAHAVDDIKKYIDEQTVQLPRPLNKPFRYMVESTLGMTADMAALLARERERLSETEPAPMMIERFPRAAEILELVSPCRQNLGPLDLPENRLEFARRVENFLRSGRFKYSLKPPAIPLGIEPVGEFLLNRREGHCEYFASAMAVICQLHGVPARLVAGYAGGDFNPVGNFYVVRQKHAHSWVEVFVPGEDWVTFDPTPSHSGSVAASNHALRFLARYLDYLQFHWANLVVSYDADQRRSLFAKFSAWLLRPTQNEDTIVGAVSAFIRELFGWRLKLNWEERLIYWAFALLVLALVLLVGYVIAVGVRWALIRLARFHRRRPSRDTPAELEFYTRFCRYIELAGIARPAGQTPAELAADLAAGSSAHAAAPELVRAYYAVAFGGKRLTPAHLRLIEDYLSRLAAALQHPRPDAAKVR